MDKIKQALIEAKNEGIEEEAINCDEHCRKSREKAINECAEISTQQACNKVCNVPKIERTIRSLLSENQIGEEKK